MPYRETDPIEYYEEATDDEDYKNDDEALSVESNSSAVLSTLDKDFEDTDPVKLDNLLQKNMTELQQAAEGYEELRQMLPSLPVTEVPMLIEETPLPYLTPLSREMIQALQSVGEEKLVDLALWEEHQQGTSQVSLMAKYGVTRNRLHKVLTGTSQPGGSQYQQGFKREEKSKTSEVTMKEVAVKSADIKQEVPRKGKGKSHGKRKLER